MPLPLDLSDVPVVVTSLPGGFLRLSWAGPEHQRAIVGREILEALVGAHNDKLIQQLYIDKLEAMNNGHRRD